MLCCTLNDAGQIINCRKPAGGSLMQRGKSQLGSILGRGVKGEASEELTPVPDWVKDAAKKDK